MGAGKTTAAEFLTNRLHRHGITARFLPEGPTTSQRTPVARRADAVACPHRMVRHHD